MTSHMILTGDDNVPAMPMTEAPPGKRGNSYVEGLSDGADLAGDAIKEALK